MTIPLQKNIVYGPINSRRLGRSLGINLLPTTIKVCTLNCLYCQYGWTRVHGKEAEEKLWPSPKHVRMAVKEALQKIETAPDYITFSGNGEPTLHPDFPQMAEIISDLRDQFSPVAKTAILSNSTLIGDEKTAAAVNNLDAKIMKLDCGTEKFFRLYNRPCCNITLQDIIDGLQKIPDVTIQTLFAKGSLGNYHPENIENWIGHLTKIKPLTVQIYTLERSYPSKKIEPVTFAELSIIQAQLEAENISADTFL